jgi:periplasmic divalent cation tolerance protein
MILVYITNSDKKSAQRIGRYLLEKRFCACVNIFPIESYYWWREKIEKAKEWVVIAKTLGENYEKIKKEIKNIHPYTVPCILKIKVGVNKEYLDWLKKEVNKF